MATPTSLLAEFIAILELLAPLPLIDIIYILDLLYRREELDADDIQLLLDLLD